MKLEVYAKSRWNADNIKDKDQRGHDGVEIQLFDELFLSEPHTYKKFEDAFDLSIVDAADIKVIHAPLISEFGLNDVNLEDMLTELDRPLFVEIVRLADYVGRKKNRMINIVIHTEYYIRQFKVAGLWEPMVDTFREMLCKYPFVQFSIENVTPIRGQAKEDLAFCNNILFDNVELALTLREELHTDRIGTVLDTCHAKITATLLEPVYNRFGNEDNFPSFFNYFRKNRDTIKLIHLATCKGNGYGNLHGLPFNSEDSDNMDELIRIMKFYKKFYYDCPITLEVREVDYLDCKNYTMTKQALEIAVSQL